MSDNFIKTIAQNCGVDENEAETLVQQEINNAIDLMENGDFRYDDLEQMCYDLGTDDIEGMLSRFCF